MLKIRQFDNSILSDYKRCPLYCKYLHIEWLKPKGLEIAATFGKAWHSALDKFFDNKSTEESNTAFIEGFKHCEGKDSKELRTIENGLNWLGLYRQNYPLEENNFEILEIEQEFAIPLGKFLYCGRIDKIIRWKEKSLFPGKIGVMDHKTSARQGYLILSPNSQIEGYMFASSQLRKEQVSIAILDQTYIYKRNDPVFRRELTTRSAKELYQWKENALTWIGLIDKGIFPANRNDACRAFGRDCEYKVLCNCQDFKSIENIKADFYVKEQWIPFRGEIEC